jgi:hypothetical protein
MPVRLLPGRARFAAKADPIGSETPRKTIGIYAGLALQRSRDWGRHCEDHLGLQRDQLLRKRLISTRIRSGKAMLNVDATALHPTKAGKPLSKFRKLAIPLLVVLGGFLQHADPPHAHARLLRTRCQRPRRRAADQRDKIAPLQSIKLHLLLQPTRGQHIALARIKSGALLHCGNSIRLMSATDQNLRLPQRNIDSRLTSVSRHYASEAVTTHRGSIHEFVRFSCPEGYSSLWIDYRESVALQSPHLSPVNFGPLQQYLAKKLTHAPQKSVEGRKR